MARLNWCLYVWVLQVRGEGVIGKYPLLKPGESEFVYQSCTSAPSIPGKGRPDSLMRGSFGFVEGTLAQPTGPEFRVVCPPLKLELPDFMY